MGLHTLWNACRTVTISDLFDIAVVSVFIYVILRLFEWTKAAATARGMLLLAMLYIAARQFGMVLTTWFLHGFFAIFIIAIVIIFQEEIRRFFERLSMWSARPTSEPFQPTIVDILVRCISQCAHERTGALIVLRGQDPLERHLDGGHAVDGKLSDPLLLSIFDVHSDGHDGAVIIENGQLRAFGAHLPLSKNLQKLAGLGTRHAAALGLAELTDAMCIVVSEQKGSIRIAHDRELRMVGGPHELERQIATFLKTEGETMTRTQRWTGVFTENKAAKIGAIILSFVLWLIFVQGFKPETKTFDIGIYLDHVPDGLTIAGLTPKHVEITLSGLQRDLDHVDPSRLHAHVDLDGFEAGRSEVEISDDDIHLPMPLRFLKANPPQVTVDLQNRLPTNAHSR